MWKRGDLAIYHNDEVGISIQVEIIDEVEGWWLVKCSDDSEVIVRPSRLKKGPIAQWIEQQPSKL